MSLRKLCTASVLMTVLLFNSSLAAPSIYDNEISDTSSSDVTARFLGSCLEGSDTATCLAIKGITALNRAARANSIQLMDGVVFKRDAAAPVSSNGARGLTELDVAAELPADGAERSERLLEMAVKSATDFFTTHNLEVKMPAAANKEIARALEEGRGKLKKMINPFFLAVGAKFLALAPLVLGALAMLTFKAVVVAKAAFLVALLVGGSRLLSGFGNNHSESSYVTGYNSAAGWSNGANSGSWSASANSAYPYARNLDDSNAPADAHEMAYNGHLGEHESQ